ncbi:TPA: host cell division inhibitor Icd-like protein [Salmonella enterica subsp. enterica serovar Poona]|nr:ash family protein [Salmonella enterica]EKB5041435.1 host cell division inhibitor Icd-like protein [Salmonella enterica]EME1067585.1 host cell division inhibitor Icd-like protein [Salmonella enterica]HEC9415914.1 host cell division inhibitor Icd-like protein [Salmonella enterica subsp. enterica serovar Poona]
MTHKTKATPKDRQCGNTKPAQDNRKSAITATCAGEEKALILMICNQYVGCTAWRSLACLFDLLYMLASIPTPASNATSTAVKKHLRTYNGLGYVNPAPHKTGAGCESPNMYKATPDAASVFFVVCYMRHSMAWCVLFNVGNYPVITHNGTHRAALIMVTLAGQPQGWPVPLYAGTLTPVNVTAPVKCESLGGDSLNLYKEAANMAMATSARLQGRTSSRLNRLNHSQSPLTPPAPLAPLFVWRFWSCQQSRYITSTATSEREARAQLPDSPCLFAARLPTQGVRHV